MSGSSNTGEKNTGHRNTGHRNTGHRNTGDNNTGHNNTGDWNTGDRNIGHWNTVNNTTGFFNTEEIDKVRIFNKGYSRKAWNNLDKPSFLYFNLTEWINESDMSEEERDANPSYKVTKGYLKKYEYKEAFKKSWDEATQEDRDKVYTLPNFDAKVFEEISGIDVSKKDNSDKIEELAKAQAELLKQAEEIKKQIEGLR